MDIEEVLDEIRESGHQRVKFAVTDIDGVLRGKYVHKGKLLEGVESGVGFCDVVFGWDSSDRCYENTRFTGWHSGYPDKKAWIDLSTFRNIPWENEQPFFLADFERSNLEVCPRTLLKKVISKSEKMGFRPMMAQEYEWFNFQETPQSLHDKAFTNLVPLTPGMFGYSILRTSQNAGYINELLQYMDKLQVPIEGLHTETGPGVYEGCILYSEALEAADRAVIFKTAVKEIAAKHHLMASFMAKWRADLPGCGGHIHQSLWTGSDKNAFFSGEGLSTIGKHYLAGLLHCLPDIMPIFAPTVNSYKRLVKGTWAPINVSWGHDNRTTAFRVINGSKRSMRIENRVPGADINPYLGMAASLSAGLYGIEHKLELKVEETTGSSYQHKQTEILPHNLYEATIKMKESDVAKEILGEAFIEHFIETRLWEWEQYMSAVTDWEAKRYFEII